MDVKFLIEPFPHIIIENQFTDDEFISIWRELKFLNTEKLNPPDVTGSAFDRDASGEKILRKNNKGLWLDHVYTDRKYSDILRCNRKIFNSEFTEKAADFHWVFRYLKYCNADTTLLSYYEDGGHYKSHPDICTMTALTHLFKEPKHFTGGELIFTDYDYNIGLVNNRTMLFPSILYHEVSNVKMLDEEEFGGRFTISQFMKLG